MEEQEKIEETKKQQEYIKFITIKPMDWLNEEIKNQKNYAKLNNTRR